MVCRSYGITEVWLVTFLSVEKLLSQYLIKTLNLDVGVEH